MSVANRKPKSRRIVPVLSVLAGAGAVCPAHADVMEITRDGPAWIAGGPVAEQAAPQAVNINQSLLTEAAVTAGPAHWQARIAELAAKYDISPALLEAVVWQESRWNAHAVSPAGACGLTQLMPATARAMGVDADDPFGNLEGGARYLRMQLDTFDGDLEKALAAYNAGPARVQVAGGIPAIRETRNYVASIMSRLSTSVRR